MAHGKRCNATSFHSLSHHLLDIVTYAENAKIIICGNKCDLEGREPEVSEAEVEAFCEQCHNKTACKMADGVEEMFRDFSRILNDANRSNMELQTLEQHGFKIDAAAEAEANEEPSQCVC